MNVQHYEKKGNHDKNHADEKKIQFRLREVYIRVNIRAWRSWYLCFANIPPHLFQIIQLPHNEIVRLVILMPCDYPIGEFKTHIQN